MKEKLNNSLNLLNKEFGLLLAISCSVAFFVLIFKPFLIEFIDFDSRIIFIIRLGVTIFFIMIIVRIIYPSLMYNIPHKLERPILSSYIRAFIIWFLSSVIFSAYLIYPGLVSLSSFLVFKVTLICLVPPIILIFHDNKEELKLQNEILILYKKNCQKQIREFKIEHENITIDFNSSNNSEKVRLLLSEVVFINSADNYVEIHYREGDGFKKKLVRNTLKNIRLKIDPYPIFIPCHRKYIVNSQYIEKFNGNCNNCELFLKGFKESIPVSRQYFYKTKNAI